MLFSTLKCVDPHAFCGRSTQDSEVNVHNSSQTLYTESIHITSGSNNNNNNNNNNNYFMSQVYLAKHRGSTNIGETGNEINTNQMKSNVGFWLEGKTRVPVPGEKPLRTE